MEWTGADIAGIVGAAVSVAGAIAARRGMDKAEKAADSAARAQASVSRTAKMDFASRAGRMFLELVGENELKVTNTLSYTPKSIEIFSPEIANREVRIHGLGPLESKKIQLRERIRITPGQRRSWDVELNWADESGEKVTQSWSFSDES